MTLNQMNIVEILNFHTLNLSIMPNYQLFYKGLVSTPHAVGLINRDTNEIITQISWDSPTSKEESIKSIWLYLKRNTNQF